MKKKNKLVFNGITEYDFATLASKLKNMIELEKLNYFYFSGEVGSGKTSYIRIILKKFGIKENIKSPSFNMVELYETKKDIIGHVDLFRLKSPVAWQNGEIGSLFDDNKTLIFLEWPEKARGLPTPDITFDISAGNYSGEEEKRDVVIYLWKNQFPDTFFENLFVK